MRTPWPPTAADLNSDTAAAMIPVKLYNLLAWCVGASEEPTLVNAVYTETDCYIKLISICQDIV